MDDHVLLANGRKRIAIVVAEALGVSRRIGRELEVRPVDGDKLLEIVQGEQAVDEEDLVRRHGKRLGNQLAQALGHGRLDLEADHRPAAAALQRTLEEADQVFRLFLHLDVRIADDAEGALPVDPIAGEEAMDEQRHRLFEADETILAVLVRRQPDEALDRAWHAQERRHAMAVGLARHLQGDGQAEIGDEGERVRRVDGERGQHREDRIEEIVLQPFAVGVADLGGIDKVDVGLVQFAAQHRPAHLLVGGEAGAGFPDGAELAGERAPVVGHHGDALALLALEAGKAHHEELVQVVGRDRQEAQLFEQRMVGVLRFLQHTPVELQPGQFAIDEARLRLTQFHACGNVGSDGYSAFGSSIRVLLVHQAQIRVSSKIILLPGKYDNSDKIGPDLGPQPANSPARAHEAPR